MDYVVHFPCLQWLSLNNAKDVVKVAGAEKLCEQVFFTSKRVIWRNKKMFKNDIGVHDFNETVRFVQRGENDGKEEVEQRTTGLLAPSNVRTSTMVTCLTENATNHAHL